MITTIVLAILVGIQTFAFASDPAAFTLAALVATALLFVISLVYDAIELVTDAYEGSQAQARKESFACDEKSR